MNDEKELSVALETLTSAMFQRPSVLSGRKRRLRIHTIHQSELLHLDNDRKTALFRVSSEAGIYKHTVCAHLDMIVCVSGHMVELH